MNIWLLLLALSVPIFSKKAKDADIPFITANNQFTPAIYKEILKTNTGNILVSPFSAEVALALVHAGAKDETAAELQQALRLPSDQQQIENGLKSLLPKLRGKTLYTANKLYVKEGFQITENFKRIATEVFNAESENIDFTRSSEASAEINKWVEKQTKNKIKNLVKSDDLDALTRAVIVNALYFKAKWAKSFNHASTQKAKFYKLDGTDVQVDTMVSRDRSWYNFYECPHLDAQIVQMPFKNKRDSLVIVLPNEKTGISKLENQLDMVFAPHEFTEQQVRVVLPKFKIESEVDFKEILANLGVAKAFGNEADFTGIAGKKGELAIDTVKQKAFIDVNEDGVEASAATFVEVSGLTGMRFRPKEFIADHPFIFYLQIRDLIVFAGRVVEPNQ